MTFIGPGELYYILSYYSMYNFGIFLSTISSLIASLLILFAGLVIYPMVHMYVKIQWSYLKRF